MKLVVLKLGHWASVDPAMMLYRTSDDQQEGMADLPAFRLASQAHLKPAHPCVPSSISLVSLRMQAEELEAVALGFEDGESGLSDQSQREAAREEVQVLSELGRASLEPVVKLYQRLLKPPQ